MISLPRTSASSPDPVVSYLRCPAKTVMTPEGHTVEGRTVFDHCHIVGYVAKDLMAIYPHALRNTLFPAGTELVAACHDIGKVCPTFCEKIRKKCKMSNLPVLARFSNSKSDLEKSWGYHAGAGKIACQAMNTPEYIADIVGQHHGFSPFSDGRTAAHESFGGSAWQHERELLVTALKQSLHTDWPLIRSDAQARMLAGLTTVSDWIGSGELFESPSQDWRPLISKAISDAGFVAPEIQPGLSFEQIFGFSPRPAQQALIDQVQGPGVYILEAPMGLGKTEAALYAAYRVLSQQQGCGIYFALPTQLTSNKLHERFKRFLEKVLAAGSPHHALLLHSQAAWLEITSMGEDGAAGGAWFNNRKRGLLAPFAVGTLDQALMSVINVKHGFVRAFGLAGKVVILDEVHSYDAYTGTLLDALIGLLRELHCTVIVLTATLDQQRRQKLLGNSVVCQRNDYPLITSLSNQAIQEICLPATAQPITQTVSLRFIGEEAPAIEEALERAEAGQQVLWIENTVNEAQDRYRDIAARAREIGGAGIDCGLLHSRFTMTDRQRLEQHWVGLFGQEGWPERGKRGRILIGTQVLEQSLDIDADFLISRFCPTDMLLQRIGRLWRHADAPRASGARCEAWILAASLEQAVEQEGKPFGSSAMVYSPYVLCRSLEVWQMLRQICLPGDIRGLIEATYAERHEENSWQKMLDELIEGSGGAYKKRKGRRALEQMARLALAPKGKTLSEQEACTRFSEIESCDVVLFKNFSSRSEQETLLTLLNGETLELPHERQKLSPAEWRKLASKLRQQIVRLPVHLAPSPTSIPFLNKQGFQHCFYLGNPEADDAAPRFALVGETDGLSGLNRENIQEKYTLSYRSDIGYCAIKL